jgi:hypothetical protein
MKGKDVRSMRTCTAMYMLLAMLYCAVYESAGCLLAVVAVAWYIVVNCVFAILDGTA